MGQHDEINVALGMTREAELTVQALQGGSNTAPAEFIGISIASGNRTPTLQFTTPQHLQGCREILFTTNTTAVGREQNQLGSI